MGPYGPKKGAVRRDDRARAHGDGEREVHRVVGRMVDGDADVQRQVVEAHVRGWGRFDLRAEQGQPLSSFVGREPLSAHLQPQDIGRLVQPEVWDEQVGLHPDKRLRQMAVRLLQNPFEADRRINHERHNQSALSGRASASVLSARA